MKQILEISSSGRNADSVTRLLSRDLVDALQDRFGAARVTRRDISQGMPFVDEQWITANFTPAEQRSAAQRKVLEFSDCLIDEIKRADVLVVGAPIYNFSIPATLKAWIDMVARARVTFRYTDAGPVGLLSGKKAYVVVATGGVAVGSPADFATPYLRHALAFIGITDVEFISADRLNSNAEESLDLARVQIADAVHLASVAA